MSEQPTPRARAPPKSTIAAFVSGSESAGRGASNSTPSSSSVVGQKKGSTVSGAQQAGKIIAKLEQTSTKIMVIEEELGSLRDENKSLKIQLKEMTSTVERTVMEKMTDRIAEMVDARISEGEASIVEGMKQFKQQIIDGNRKRKRVDDGDEADEEDDDDDKADEDEDGEAGGADMIILEAEKDAILKSAEALKDNSFVVSFSPV